DTGGWCADSERPGMPRTGFSWERATARLIEDLDELEPAAFAGAGAHTSAGSSVRAADRPSDDPTHTVEVVGRPHEAERAACHARGLVRVFHDKKAGVRECWGRVRDEKVLPVAGADALRTH